jgi:hypothetical protein
LREGIVCNSFLVVLNGSHDGGGSRSRFLGGRCASWEMSALVKDHRAGQRIAIKWRVGSLNTERDKTPKCAKRDRHGTRLFLISWTPIPVTRVIAHAARQMQGECHHMPDHACPLFKAEACQESLRSNVVSKSSEPAPRTE